MSIDGYIATTDHDLSWLSVVERAGEDYGYSEFISGIDTVIVGRKTYDKVLSMGFDFPHADKECYIITRTPQAPVGNIRFFTGNLSELITDLQTQPGKNIFCDGGAEIVNLLLQDRLMDELIVSIIPVFLGSGVRLFKDGQPPANARLVRAQSYDSGLVQLHYHLS